MSVDIKQLRDHNTNLPFVPVTHWDAVASKPSIVSSEHASSVSGLSLYVAVRIPVIDKTSDTGTTFDIEPNTMYMFGLRTNLTINFISGEPDVVNEYLFQFTSGEVATTLNVPNTVVWLKEPDVKTGKKYMVSIENNLGIIGEWNNE